MERFPELQSYRETVPEQTEFAVRLRYDDLPWLTEAEATEAYKVVGKLPEAVSRIIGVVSSSPPVSDRPA